MQLKRYFSIGTYKAPFNYYLFFVLLLILNKSSLQQFILMLDCNFHNLIEISANLYIIN